MDSYAAQDIRNIGLFGHGGAGKTTLVEAMLYASGATSRLGTVQDGTTASDYDPDEIKRHSSIAASVVPVEHAGCKLNLVDAPGYAEFAGEVASAMRVVDCAVIVVDAHAGIEVGADLRWREAEQAGLPRVVVVNKMDHENADFEGVVGQLRAQWGESLVPLLLPVGREAAFRGVANALTRRARLYPARGEPGSEETAPPDEVAADVERYRDLLTERIAETDDALTMKYLEGEEITPEELHAGLRSGVASGQIVPVLAASGGCLIGAPQLLDALAALAPSPLDRAERADDGAELSCDQNAPLAALVFKTVADPFVGKLTYFRVYSGALASDSHVRNVRTGEGRIGQLFTPRGKEQIPTGRVGPGDIGAVAKLVETATGDTLCAAEHPMTLRGFAFPEPSYTAALRPRTKPDLDKMGPALARMIDEDPSLRLGRDAQSGETLLSGLGESHVQITAERMQRKFGVAVELGLPSVPYRETITTPARAEYKHKKQTGGHGQYGHVVLSIEPMADAEFEFVHTVVGGAVPRNYYPAVEKGVQEAMHAGVLAGFPVVNVRVTLTDGSYHAVDSSEMAFKLAAAHAFKQGVSEAHPVLLEPVMALAITVPDALVGETLSDLNGKRARVEGMDQTGAGLTTVRAHAPLAEMQRYSGDLRAMTQGRGVFTMQFSHYEPVPPHLAGRVTEAVKGTEQRASNG